jgi:hypothetical protein
VTFAPDGKRFLLLDRDGFLHEFSFPDCRLLVTARETDLRKVREDYGIDIDSYGYAARSSSSSSVTKSWPCVRATSGLPPQDVDANVRDTCTVLPNGLLSTRYRDGTDVTEFRLGGRPFPVVAAIDSETTRAVAVYRKARSRWQQADDEVGWLDLNFSVRRE